MQQLWQRREGDTSHDVDVSVVDGDPQTNSKYISVPVCPVSILSDKNVWDAAQNTETPES